VTSLLSRSRDSSRVYSVAWKLVHGWIGSARFGSARHGTENTPLLYDCVIAERVSLLQSLYGVNTPQYYVLTFINSLILFGIRKTVISGRSLLT
jgi:hypothetical protein